ncbi:MAG: TerC family protein [Hyphomonadaceae bacterium]
MDHFIALAQSPEAWLALVTLVTMEVVLGIDNLLFISILTNKLPAAQRPMARRIGIGLALGMRLVLLASIAWIAQLREPVITAFGHAFSWRDIILAAGGLFLIYKATGEIRRHIDPGPDEMPGGAGGATIGFAAVIVQFVLVVIVFSVDSILTAIGMTDELAIMVVAVLIAVGVMMFAADPVGDFVHRHPTVVMLALGFLLMIGVMLIAEGFGFHVPKGYVYAAMAFSAGIEALNMWGRSIRDKRRAQAQARDGAAAPVSAPHRNE